MATYTMIGATTPSLYPSGTFQSAIVNSSTLEVHFGTSSALMNLSMTIDGGLAAGSLPMNLSGAHMSGSGGSMFGGGFCGSLSASGFLAGEGGVRAGVAYVIDGCSQNCGQINGAIAYQRGAVVPSNLQVLRQEQVLVRGQ
jgi:hypothetical protein